MKSSLRKLLLSAVLLFSFNIHAETQEISGTLAETAKKKWSVEGQFNTISNSTTATFGPSIFYAINPKNSVGFRFLGDQVPGPVSCYRASVKTAWHFRLVRT